jgi:uncharacterized membrane protein YccF (DUF307 family)
MKYFFRIGFLASIACLLAPVTFAGSKQTVPDAATAIRIAEVALIPIYGRKQIESERPFTAKLTKNIWFVAGHLHEGWVGGVAEIWIDKRDGHVLRYIHGK